MTIQTWYCTDCGVTWPDDPGKHDDERQPIEMGLNAPCDGHPVEVYISPVADAYVAEYDSDYDVNAGEIIIAGPSEVPA